MTKALSSSQFWYLSGPTASGKTLVGRKLARALSAEVLSLDSMAIYRGMDIGTAKPTLEDRQAVPHHLLDLVEPHEDFSLAQFVELSHRAAAAVAAQGKTPLFVGGTPLYLKAMLRGIFQGPAADWELRRRWETRAGTEEDGWLHAQLSAVDPVAASRLHPRDRRRLIRALEVYELTGRPISEWQRQFEEGRPAGECRVFVLDWPRGELMTRIDERVDRMFAAGLVDEVRGLLAGPRKLSRTASQAIGYCEVMAHLSGERGLEETIELVKTRTRQFARRQLTWFRSLSECRWIGVDAGMDPDVIVETILRASAHRP